MAINEQKLNEFLGKAIVDFGATFHAALINIGDKLGLYKALAAGGHQTSALAIGRCVAHTLQVTS